MTKTERVDFTFKVFGLLDMLTADQNQSSVTRDITCGGIRKHYTIDRHGVRTDLLQKGVS